MSTPDSLEAIVGEFPTLCRITSYLTLREQLDHGIFHYNFTDDDDIPPEIVATMREGDLACRAVHMKNMGSPEYRAEWEAEWSAFHRDPRIKAIDGWCAQKGWRLSADSARRFTKWLALKHEESYEVVAQWAFDRVIKAMGKPTATCKTGLATAAESIPEMKRLHALTASECDPVTNPALRTLGWLNKSLPEMYSRDDDTPEIGKRRAAMANAIHTDPHVQMIERWAARRMKRLNPESVEELILLIAKTFKMLPREVELLKLDQIAGMLPRLEIEGDGAAPEVKSAATPPAVVRPNANRNAWCYEVYVNRPQTTVESLRREAKEHGWRIDSNAAFDNNVKAHCKAKCIMIPRRTSPRIKQN